MKYIFLPVLLLAFSLFGCNKYDNMDLTLTGRIIDSLTNEPIANTDLLLYACCKDGKYGKPIGPTSFSFSTKEEGYFKVVYNTGSGGTLNIQYPGERVVWDGGMYYIWTGTGASHKELAKDIGTVRAYKR